jgi:Xaa-Pro aminopeptidase
MKSRLSPIELDRVRRSCRIAALAFDRGRNALRAGLEESEAFALFREPLFTIGIGCAGA